MQWGWLVTCLQSQPDLILSFKSDQFLPTFLVRRVLMNEEQFDQLIEVLGQQKRMIAYIGLYVTYQFWALVIIVLILLLALIF